MNVSDHALVRFIERVKGLSLDNYRAEMTTLAEAHKGDAVLSGCYDDAALFVIEHLAERPTIVTVLPPNFRPKKQQRQPTRTVIRVPLPNPTEPE